MKIVIFSLVWGSIILYLINTGGYMNNEVKIEKCVVTKKWYVTSENTELCNELNYNSPSMVLYKTKKAAKKRAETVLARRK